MPRQGRLIAPLPCTVERTVKDDRQCVGLSHRAVGANIDEASTILQNSLLAYSAGFQQ